VLVFFAIAVDKNYSLTDEWEMEKAGGLYGNAELKKEQLMYIGTHVV